MLNFLRGPHVSFFPFFYCWLILPLPFLLQGLLSFPSLGVPGTSDKTTKYKSAFHAERMSE